MWNTQRNHLNFMKNQTVISFDHEVLISTLDRPKKAWNDGTNVELFFILKLCFLQGLLLRSDQIWVKVFLKWLSNKTATVICAEVNVFFRLPVETTKDLTLYLEDGKVPWVCWKSGFFLSLIKQGCIILNIHLLVRTC